MADDDLTPTAGDEPTDSASVPTDEPDLTAESEGVVPIEIQTEMEQSFLEYAMSVIVSRALPDVRDGLKPVHRRILWSMFDSGVRPDRGHVKCATVVGDVIGKYHPHGDTAIYDSLVRMGQTFSLRHTLIDPHGNFGSPDDPPAAYRYTECRLTPLAMQMMADINEDTVDFAANFDGRHDEPTVLPSRFPNLLVNGSQGIAVGMATNIPPHNLGEVIDATTHLIDNPEATVDDLMEFVKAPGFPTGAQILGRVGARDAYRTGRGSVRMRAVAEIVEGKTHDQIVVTELPYQVSLGQVSKKVKEIVDRGDLHGIREMRDLSSKGKTRLVFDLKRDAPALVVLNNLYKYTPLQTSFGVNMVALVDGVPRTLNLREMLVAYVEHQREVITRRTEYRLDQKRKREHIVEGLIKALDLIDEIIAAIRASEDRGIAKEKLMAAPFEFSEIQTNHILDMQLSRLTRLGRTNLEEELAEIREAIAELEAILASEERLREVIKDELSAIRGSFANERRTALVPDPGELDIEDLIDDEHVIITMTSSGYIKSSSIDEFRSQRRGGRGVAGARTKDDDDVVSHLVHTTAHAYLLFFSNRGRVYRIKAHEVPIVPRTNRGMALVNLLPLSEGERIQAVIDTRDYETKRFLFFATRLGRVKKTLFNAYDSSRRDGLIAINMNDGDELVTVFPTDGDDDVFLFSHKGQAIRFSENDVRPMGRSAAGVTGMRFRGDDQLVSGDVVQDETDLFVVTADGFGKRTAPSEFMTKGRGGLGIRVIRVSERRGDVVGALLARPGAELVLVSTAGVVIRIGVDTVSRQGRDAAGVTVMSLDDGDQVAAVTRMFLDDAELNAELDEVEGVEHGLDDGETPAVDPDTNDD